MQTKRIVIAQGHGIKQLVHELFSIEHSTGLTSMNRNYFMKFKEGHGPVNNHKTVVPYKNRVIFYFHCQKNEVDIENVNEYECFQIGKETGIHRSTKQKSNMSYDVKNNCLNGKGYSY